MNTVVLLHQSALRDPDAPAVCHGDEVSYTYAALAETACAIGQQLRTEQGLAPGDRVALAMTNNPHYLAVLYGVWWAGLVAVPMNPRLHRREFERLIGDSGARLCVTTADLDAPGTVPVIDVTALAALHRDSVLRPPAEVRPEDPAWLFYTSGTTGKAKAATLTHRNLVTAILSTLADIGDAADASLLHLTPLSHAGGLIAIAFTARGQANVLPREGIVDAATLDDTLSAFGPVSFFAVPTILRRLLHPDLLPDRLIPKVRRIFYGGAPTYVEDLREVVARFGAQRLWQAFGQGESPCTITHLTPLEHLELPSAGRLMNVGHARTGVQVAVLSEADDPLPPGEIGEVVVRGDTVMAGYWNNPTATATALRGGWLHTGDLGRMDERGRLTLVDRAKDLIISGGSNIYPREIEEILLTHPAVVEAAVIGRPDTEWGELPTAFVVTAPETTVTTGELDALCLESLARYKRPRDYHFLPELPKNGYGKILKTHLRTVDDPNKKGQQ